MAKGFSLHYFLGHPWSWWLVVFVILGLLANFRIRECINSWAWHRSAFDSAYSKKVKNTIKSISASFVPWVSIYWNSIQSMTSTWHYFGINLALTWNGHSINLAATWHYLGISLTSTYHYPCINLTSTWYYHGINLALAWHLPGMNLTSSWHYPAINLTSSPCTSRNDHDQS